MRRTMKGIALAAVLCGSAGSGSAGDLSVFDWAGYDDEGFFGAYVQKYGGPPAFSFYADEEEAFNKLQAGFSADIAHPCIGSVFKWRDAGLLKPIDATKISDWNSILPQISALKEVQSDGKVWMVPFEWGNTGLVIRTDKVDEATANLQLFADPSMAGRVSIPDGVEDAYLLAALATGVTDWAAMTPEDVTKASDFLRAVHKNVRFYWTDSGQLTAAMTSGEIDMAWAWNDAEVTLIGEDIPAKMIRRDDVGIASWVCGYVHLASGTTPDEEVYDFLNSTLSVDSGKYILETWGYAHSNAKAFKAADQELMASYGYSDLDAFIARSMFATTLKPEIRDQMIKEFERIKAGF